MMELKQGMWGENKVNALYFRTVKIISIPLLLWQVGKPPLLQDLVLAPRVSEFPSSIQDPG